MSSKILAATLTLCLALSACGSGSVKASNSKPDNDDATTTSISESDPTPDDQNAAESDPSAPTSEGSESSEPSTPGDEVDAGSTVGEQKIVPIEQFTKTISELPDGVCPLWEYIQKEIPPVETGKEMLSFFTLAYSEFVERSTDAPAEVQEALKAASAPVFELDSNSAGVPDEQLGLQVTELVSGEVLSEQNATFEKWVVEECS